MRTFADISGFSPKNTLILRPQPKDLRAKRIEGNKVFIWYRRPCNQVPTCVGFAEGSFAFAQDEAWFICATTTKRHLRTIGETP